MVIHEIQADIEVIEGNQTLYDEENFDGRVGAIDFIEFNVIERIEGLPSSKELVGLKQRAESVKRRLEEINANLLQRLRADIRTGVCIGATLKSQIEKYVGHNPKDERQNAIGYDSLDVFINGLLLIKGSPGETTAREPEMVSYQPTPARIILELIEKAPLTENDVFYDLGSGLGQVPMLVHLLSGARAKGIEFEPAYCDYARQCAAELGLSGVEFVNSDARESDYSDGTVFFMYTPFGGKILQEVLEKLKKESDNRTIKVYTYGPCTPIVSQQRWLKRVDQNGADAYKLGIFISRVARVMTILTADTILPKEFYK